MAITPSAVIDHPQPWFLYHHHPTHPQSLWHQHAGAFCRSSVSAFLAEKKLLENTAEVRAKLEEAIKPFRYNRWLVVLTIGLSCGSFSLTFFSVEIGRSTSSPVWPLRSPCFGTPGDCSPSLQSAVELFGYGFVATLIAVRQQFMI